MNNLLAFFSWADDCGTKWIPPPSNHVNRIFLRSAWKVFHPLSPVRVEASPYVEEPSKHDFLTYQ